MANGDGAARDYRDMTREELYELAQERDIEGRSQMSKDELVAAHEREDTGPDAVALLTRQHRAVTALFDEFGELSPRPSNRKQELVREIITTLVKHAEIEEQVFYPAVRAEVEGVADEVDEDLEEHHAAELLLAELDHLPTDADRFDAKVKVLMENVRHHIEEEESDLFPTVRDQMSEERRRELGSAMETLWRIAPTRPHPASPSTPPANVVAGLSASVRDLAVNSLRGLRQAARPVERGRQALRALRKRLPGG